MFLEKPCRPVPGFSATGRLYCEHSRFPPTMPDTNAYDDPDLSWETDINA